MARDITLRWVISALDRGSAVVAAANKKIETSTEAANKVVEQSGVVAATAAERVAAAANTAAAGTERGWGAMATAAEVAATGINAAADSVMGSEDGVAGSAAGMETEAGGAWRRLAGIAEVSAAQINKAGDAAASGMNKAAVASERSLSAIGGAAVTFTKGLGIMAAVGGGALAYFGIKFDSIREQAQIAFTVMLNSGQKATKFLDQLQKVAARTPFEFQGLIQNAQQLLAAGFKLQQVMPLLLHIGDAVSALGTGQEGVNRLILAFQQIHTTGRLMSGDMRQIMSAGVPMAQALADFYGKTTAEIQVMITTGKISSEDAVKAFEQYTDAHFKGLMQRQSRTWQGLWSTVHDVFQAIAGKVMAPFFGWAEGKLVRLTDFMTKLSTIKDLRTQLVQLAQGAGDVGMAVGNSLLDTVFGGGPQTQPTRRVTRGEQGQRRVVMGVGPRLTTNVSVGEHGQRVVTHGRAAPDTGLVGMLGITPAQAKAAREGIVSGLGAVVDFVTKAIPVIRSGMKSVGPIVLEVFNGLVSAGKQLWDALKPFEPFFTNILVPLFKGFAKSLIDTVKFAFMLLIGALKVLGPIFGWVGKQAAPFKGVIEDIGYILGLVFGPAIIGWIGKVAKGVTEAMPFIRRLAPLFDFVFTAIAKVVEVAVTVVNKALGLLIRGFKLYWGMIRPIVEPVAKWFAERISNLVKFVLDHWPAIKRILINPVRDGLSTIRSVFSRLWGWLGPIIQNVIGKLETAWGRLSKLWTKLRTDAQVGWAGIVGAIRVGVNTLIDAWNWVVGNIPGIGAKLSIGHWGGGGGGGGGRNPGRGRGGNRSGVTPAAAGFLPKQAIGNINAAVPGGMLHVLEGGDPEAVISLGPRHRRRSIAIAAEVMRRFKVMPHEIDQGILPDASVQQHGIPGFQRGGIARGQAHGGRLGGTVQRAMLEAMRISALHLPYVWGGGHQTPAPANGPFDCSGFVSRVLQAAGVNIPTMVSGSFMSAGSPGPGPLEVVANMGHVYMGILGKFFGTSSGNPGGGPGPLPYGVRPGFVVRHFGPGGPGGGGGGIFSTIADLIGGFTSHLGHLPGGMPGRMVGSLKDTMLHWLKQHAANIPGLLVQGVGQLGFGIRNLERSLAGNIFDNGGIVPGRGPQLAIVHGGETIVPTHRGGGGGGGGGGGSHRFHGRGLFEDMLHTVAQGVARSGTTVKEVKGAFERLLRIVHRESMKALERHQREVEHTLRRLRQGSEDKAQRESIQRLSKLLNSIQANIYQAINRQIAMTEHKLTMAQSGLSNLQLRQQLRGVDQTPGAQLAQGRFIRQHILPGLRRELGLLREQAREDRLAHHLAKLRQDQEAIAAKQTEILQAQLDAQTAIKSATQDSADRLKELSGSTTFDFSGQRFTDLLGVGVGA